MAETARWNNHIFEVSPNLVRGFDSLSVTGSAAVEEKSTGNQAYASYKNGGCTQVTMKALLSAFTGCDVREEAMAFVDEARRGCYGYLYVNGKKLVACPLMLTSASISETEIAPGGTWTYAEAKLTFKQCDKYDGESSGSNSSKSSSGSSGSSKSGSVKSAEATDWRYTYTSRLRRGEAADRGLVNARSVSTVGTTADGRKAAQEYINSKVTKASAASSANSTASARAGNGTKVQLIQ